MSDGARSAATLLGLCALLVVATLWGWSAATAPFPQEEEVPICVVTEVAAGEEVFTDNVVVDVYNGSKRQRLASSKHDQLVERGFIPGASGNAPEPSKATVIIASDPDSPAAKLVQRQFRGARVVEGNELGEGVTVVVGEGFTSLRPKVTRKVAAAAASSYCKATGSA